jgi:hypothetical protein
VTVDSVSQVADSILLVLVGWLLATLNPGIVDAIKRRKRKTELLHAFAVELRELRYKAVLVLWHQRAGTGSLDQSSLAIVKTHVFDHPIADGEPDIAASLKELLRIGDSPYIAFMNAKGVQENLGAWPALYSLPFVSARATEFTLFDLGSQASLMRVLEELNLYNNQVEYVRDLNNKTFTLTGDNHGINAANLAKAQRRLADRAEILARAISRLIDPKGHPNGTFR